MTDNGGWTPLSEAVAAGQLESVRLLIQKGARVDCVSKESFAGDDEPV